ARRAPDPSGAGRLRPPGGLRAGGGAPPRAVLPPPGLGPWPLDHRRGRGRLSPPSRGSSSPPAEGSARLSAAHRGGVLEEDPQAVVAEAGIELGALLVGAKLAVDGAGLALDLVEGLGGMAREARAQGLEEAAALGDEAGFPIVELDERAREGIERI